MNYPTRYKSMGAPLPAKQERSRATRNAFLAAGWRLLAKTPWETIGVNDLVKAANSSVGSFYSRFTDRDAFFDAMAMTWVQKRMEVRAQQLAAMNPHSDYATDIVMEIHTTVIQNRNFWRAALARGTQKPGFWAPFRESGLNSIQEFLRLRRTELGRELTAEEDAHIRFAFQMIHGVINNAVINRPGPLKPETREFEEALVRGFKVVAGLLPSAAPAGRVL